MIQIISPHIDDATLSLGGSIFEWLNKNIDVKVYYIFSISDWTNPKAISGLQYAKNVDEITELRKNEEKNVSIEMDYSYEYFDFFDQPLRKTETNDEILKSNIKRAIIDKIDKKEITLFPLATGDRHYDHFLIKEIGIQLTSQDYNIGFYEDLPYMASEKSHQGKTKIISEMGLKPVINAIDFEKKSKIINLYSSQVSEDWEILSRAYEYSIPDNLYYERYWIRE